MKAFIVRLPAAVRELPFVVRKSIGYDSKTIAAEQLEPRILYSAAPVDASVTEAETPTQEAPAAAPADAVVETPPMAEAPAEVPVAAAIEGDGENSEIAEGQEVALIDVDQVTATLNQDVVETLAVEARQRWIDSGISAEQIAALDSVSYHVADVGGAHLGVANGFSITIDDDAGGTGVGNWFIDATPGDDAEFGGNDSAASGRYDLLSTLIHEQGHVLGLGDRYDQRSDVMHGFLDVGTRRLPVEGQAEGAIAGAIAGDNFLTANIVRASTDSSGSQVSGGSSVDPVLSGNGRYVVFQSGATNLVEYDTNGETDIFVKDLQTGEIRRVSTDSDGMQATGGGSVHASISTDGRYVAFASGATNLVEGDTNGSVDIFVKDLLTGVVTRASTTSQGAQSDPGASGASNPVISGDGRYVAFTSSAGDLIDDDTNLSADIFRKDLKTGKIVRVSVSATDRELRGSDTNHASISADGRYIVFESRARFLVDGAESPIIQVYHKDVKSGAISRLSVNDAGDKGDAHSTAASVSADGRFVVFRSEAENLVTGDSNGVADIFIRDTKEGTTGLVSTDSNGLQTDAQSSSSAVSADGNLVTFSSVASNLVTGDGNGLYDVFVKNLSTGEIERISTSADGTESTGGQSLGPAFSADGRFIAFTSAATNLVIGDTNFTTDIFVKGIGSLTRTFTTSVEIDAMGHLVIEDFDGDTDDNLLIGLKEGVLEISDRKAMIGSSIAGSTLVNNKGRGVQVDLRSFGGDIIVRTFDGDDTITIGDLSGLPGGVTIEDGDGHDLIKQKGVVTLTGSAAIDYAAESIRLEKKSGLASDGGDIEIAANSTMTSTVKSTGVIGRSGAMVSSSAGNISIVGIGGDVGSGNRGVDLRSVDVAAMVGDVTIAGLGGEAVSNNRGLFLKAVAISAGDDIDIAAIGRGTGNGNHGLILAKNTTLTTIGTGAITVRGDSHGMTSNNRGVIIQNGVEIRSESGAVTVRGTGGNAANPADVASGSKNIGLQVGQATIDSSAGGDILIIGAGGGLGSKSMGAVIKGATFSTTSTSTDAIRVLAVGAVDGTGSGNAGMLMKATQVTAEGSVKVEGNSGAGHNGNYGLRLHASTLVSSTRGATASGNPMPSPWTTSGNSNFGSFVSNTRIEGFQGAGVIGVSREGGNDNFGVRLRNVDIDSDISGVGAIVLGVSSEATTGSNNRGVDAKGGMIVGSIVNLIQEGGGGKSNNEALKLNGTRVTALAGAIDIEAGGTLVLGMDFDIDPVTSGKNNRAANFINSTLTATGDININAVSSGGTSNNAGLQSSNSIFDAEGNLNITASGDADSTGNNNRGFFSRGGSFVAAMIDIDAERGGGVNNNEALFVDGSTLQADGGDLLINAGFDDTAQTTGKKNSGVYLRDALLSAPVSVDISGSAGGGSLDNVGVKALKSRLQATTSVNVNGTSVGEAGARGATGIFLRDTHLLAKGDVQVSGSGGLGDRDNRGIYVVGGSYMALNGGTRFDGTADPGTTGTGNVGVYAFNGVEFAGGTEIVIDGVGGGGTGMNFGVFMDKNITAPRPMISGLATDGVSANEAGDFR